MAASLIHASASFIAALYAAEGALGLRDAWLEPPSRLSLLASARARGEGATLSVEPRRWLSAPEAVAGRVYPLSGFAGRETIACQEGSSVGMYLSDLHGFNNPDAAWVRGAVDVALVGDSYVHGDCVAQSETIGGVLRAEGVRALNLGMRGSGPLTELAILTEYAAVVRPQVVVWVYDESSDLLDLQAELQSPLLKRYTGEGFSQRLVDRQKEAERDVLEPFLAHRLDLLADAPAGWRSRASGLLRLSLLRGMLGLSGSRRPVAISGVPELRQVFEIANRRVSGWGGHLIVAFLPTYSNDGRAIGRLAGSAMASIADDLGITAVDLGPVIDARANGRSLLSCAGCHFGPEGYRAIARSLVKGLRR